MNLEGRAPKDEILRAYERAESDYAQAKTWREQCRAVGDWRGERKAQAKMDRADALSTEYHQLLFPPHIGSVYDAPEPKSNCCAYCNLPLADDEWITGICPVCDPDKPEGLDSRDPRWTPYQAERNQQLNARRNDE